MNEHKQQKPENDVEANKQVPNEANAPVDGTSASEAPGDSEQDRIIAEQAAEIAVLKDKMLRAMADVENMRHR
ncbi:MAG: hypothetical protein K9G33_10140, partial [Sneathiella sp.]|nr:hypothetical protein [Sneathiella sp.]